MRKFRVKTLNMNNVFLEEIVDENDKPIVYNDGIRIIYKKEAVARYMINTKQVFLKRGSGW